MPAPIAPGGLAAFGITENIYGFNWYNGEVYDSIHIEKKTGAGGTYVEISSIGGTETSSTGWTSGDGLLYYLRLRGYTATKGYSDYCDEAYFQLALKSPFGLTGSGAPTEVTLNWSSDSFGADGFNIYKNGVYLASVGASLRTYTATGLTAATYYDFYVTSYNSAVESGASNTVRIFTADPPAACYGLTAVSVATDKIRLAWTNPADNEDEVYVYRSTDGVSYSKIATLSANSSAYTATGLTSNTLYYFYVSNYNISGESAASNITSTSTMAAISQPTNLTVVPIDEDKADIYFDDNSSEEDGHSLEFRELDYTEEKVTDGGLENWTPASGTDTYSSAGTFTWTAPAGVTAVQVECWGGGGGGGGDDSTRGGGGGGGGGAYSKKNTVTVTPGNTYQVIVGAAGSAGSDGADGGAGGDSKFNTTDCVAKGGTGGKGGQNNGTKGTGGAAASGTGDTKYSGGDGGAGDGYADDSETAGGGGGSSAGTVANGNNGGNASGNTAGNGGAAPTGGAAGGNGGTHENNGSDGSTPGGGGGGSGSRQGGGGSLSGGAGKAGKVILTYTATPTDLTSWTETKGGTSTIQREASEVHAGTYSLKASVDGSDNNAYIYQSETLIAGNLYRLSVWYKTAASKTLALWLKDSASNIYLKSDGTWGAGAQYITLPASTDWISFSIDFTAHASYTNYILYVGHLNGTSTQTSASFYLDAISMLGYPSFAEKVLLAPNQFCYRQTGLTKATPYEWRVRAKQGAVYSSYSDTVVATTFDDPTAASALTATEESDVSIRLAWTEPDDDTVAGYKIEKSTDGGANFSAVIQVPKGVAEYLVLGLTPSTRYDFRLCSYSIVGDAAYTSTAYATTKAAYEESKFEALMRRNPEAVVILAELNPKMAVTGWALSGGTTYTYESAWDEARATVDQVYQNGEAMTKRTSAADVETYASSFYYDHWARILYVHTADGDSPEGYIIEAGFWIGATNWKTATEPMSFLIDGIQRDYLPMLSGDSIPEVQQDAALYYKSGSAFSSGEIRFKNGAYYGNEYFWDTRYARYTWSSRAIVIRAGGIDFDYSDFVPVFTGFIDAGTITDRDVSFSLTDPRLSVNATIPPNKFTAEEYYNIPEKEIGKPIPICYGTVAGVVPVCVDETNKVFKVCDHRIKGISSATLNGVTITEDTDFFVDYQRGLIVFHRDNVAYSSSDKFVLTVSGAVNEADEIIEDGADVFWSIARTYIGLEPDELDAASIFWTKTEKDYNLAFYAYRSANDGSGTLLRTIEHSLQAVTFLSNDGLLGLYPLTTDDPPNVIYLPEELITGYAKAWNKDSLFDWIIVYYAESMDDNSFAAEAYDYAAERIRSRIQKDPLEVDTFLTTQADAQTLRTAIVSMLGKDSISFETNGIMMRCHPGQIFRLTRARDYNESGSSSAAKMRIISISKNIAAKKCRIVAEEVA